MQATGATRRSFSIERSVGVAKVLDDRSQLLKKRAWLSPRRLRMTDQGRIDGRSEIAIIDSAHGYSPCALSR
jgi:hypothetical protein